MAEQLPHLIFNRTAITKAYQAPRRAIVSEFKLAPRDRQQHGSLLLDELQQVQAQESGLVADQKALGRDAGMGVYLTFESDPGFELAFESLGFAPSGIELLAVKEEEGRMFATVFVPEGKISHFIRKVEAYLDPVRDTTNKKDKLQPKNRKLVESIGQIRLAALEALWTDIPELFPRNNQPIWWEVWLRCGQSFDEVGFFRTHARAMGMEVPDEEVRFLERCILLVRADINQMARSLHLLGALADLRQAMPDMFAWTPADPELPLHLLVAAKAERSARTLSCHQDIASHSAATFIFLAEFDAPIHENPAAWRHLHWEAGMLGHCLTLEAEAAGWRGTGIGCFFDDAVHEVLGLGDTRYQVVYHFALGIPIDDPRLMSLPAYA